DTPRSNAPGKTAPATPRPRHASPACWPERPSRISTKASDSSSCSAAPTIRTTYRRSVRFPTAKRLLHEHYSATRCHMEVRFHRGKAETKSHRGVLSMFRKVKQVHHRDGELS